jgi:hypothetical protein
VWHLVPRCNRQSKRENPELNLKGQYRQMALWPSFSYAVRKMGLILRSIERMLKMQFSMARKFTLQPLRRYGSIERMLKMQFSMARKFTLQPLRRYDVKPPEKTAQAYYYV